MKTYQIGKNTLNISNYCFNELRRGLKSLAKIPEEKFASFLMGEAYSRLCISDQDEFFKRCKELSGKEIQSAAILYAHGDHFFKKWTYEDGLLPKKVQTWVDQNDGKYDLLLLHSCNPIHEVPKISKSIAVVPNDYLSHILNLAGEEHLLMIPGQNVRYIGRNGIRTGEKQ
jgi:hypothetical protein